MKQFLISIFILSLFTSCGLFVKKVSFTDKELEWFNVYNVNDTLVFKSLLKHEKDTSIINYKKLFYDYDWLRHDYRAENMSLSYTNKIFVNKLYYNDSEFMFSGRKTYPSNGFNWGYSFNYLRSSFILDENTIIKPSVTLTLSNKSFNNVYELVYKRLKFHGGTNDDPEILYWDKKHGIIKYITFNGEVWERINWKN